MATQFLLFLMYCIGFVSEKGVPGEAEEKFAQRGKILNKWAVMVYKKLRAGEEGAE